MCSQTAKYKISGVPRRGSTLKTTRIGAWQSIKIHELSRRARRCNNLHFTKNILAGLHGSSTCTHKIHLLAHKSALVHGQQKGGGQDILVELCLQAYVILHRVLLVLILEIGR